VTGHTGRHRRSCSETGPAAPAGPVPTPAGGRVPSRASRRSNRGAHPLLSAPAHRHRTGPVTLTARAPRGAGPQLLAPPGADRPRRDGVGPGTAGPYPTASARVRPPARLRGRMGKGARARAAALGARTRLRIRCPRQPTPVIPDRVPAGRSGGRGPPGPVRGHGHRDPVRPHRSAVRRRLSVTRAPARSPGSGSSTTAGRHRARADRPLDERRPP
jgi:hypothetical protein